MLNGEGNEKGKKNNNDSNKTKQNNRSKAKKKKKIPLAAHIFVHFCSCFRLLQRETSYTSYSFYRGNVT